jgi:argininosuccinate synthase
MSRVVFAFSGWPDEARAIRQLVEQEGDEVVTLTLDLGQGQDLDSVRSTALAAGAVRAHVIDVRDALIADFFLPALRGCGASTGGVVLARDLASALIVRSLVEIADVESTTFVAHGATAQDGERHALFEALVEDLAPQRFSVIWAATLVDAASEPEQLEASQTSVAREWRVPGPRATPFPQTAYRLTREPASAPDVAAHVDVRFERGVPVALNGVGMSLAELLASLDTIVGAHGVGRYDGLLGSYFDRRDPPIHHRGEAPAALVLAASLDALERRVWSTELYDLKEQMAGSFRRVVRRGQWFSATRQAMGAFVDRAHTNVTGTVELHLFKGGSRVIDVVTDEDAPASAGGREPGAGSLVPDRR